jgi:lipopolysaccharide export system protein LptA
LVGINIVATSDAARGKRRVVKDNRVYLIHSDELKFDMFGPNPGAQIVKGNVHFSHQGAQLWCDSAYFYQESNSVKAFGHVRYQQGKNMRLRAERASYDGQAQLLEARKNVVLNHGKQVLYTDSLDYDRLYDYAYFFDGGRLVDGKDNLSSDWGEYSTKTHDATFYYNVRMRNGNRLIETDTLHYNTENKIAHITGPSKINQNGSIINTEDGFFNTTTDKAELYGRSTIVDANRTITGDSLYYNRKTGLAQGYGNVIYVDSKNKNTLTCERMNYNEKTGFGWATGKAVAKDYSQKDTLYVHADSMKIYTYNINTDSLYRVVHCFDHVKAYRIDAQAICDSMVITTKDSCMTMYRDPIVWNGDRQILGEVIKVYMSDSTIRDAHVIGQALSVELMYDKKHYNQISSKVMDAYFENGNIRRTVASGNVKSIYYPVDDQDSSLIGLNYLESDTIKMYMDENRKLERIWVPKPKGTTYPMTQIPAGKEKLLEFAWFEDLRPTDPIDILEWRGKGDGQGLKEIKRHDAPLQRLPKKEMENVAKEEE